jgi:photosystem II stability/assembly factor-like uncharacterized protein
MSHYSMVHMLRRLLLCAAAVIAIPVTYATAQTDIGGTWRDLDAIGAAGLPTSEHGTIPDSFYFFDGLSGVRAIRPDNGGDRFFATSDGGATWQPIAAMPPLPTGRLEDGFAWTRSGETSTDGGKTWSPADAAGYVDFRAASRSDRSALRGTPGEPVRLVATSDAGATWEPIDVLAGDPAAISSTIYGDFSLPATIANRRIEWLHLVHHDASTIAATIRVTGTVDGAASTTYYLVVADRTARTVRTIALPMWRDNRTIAARPPIFVRPPSTFIVAEYEYDTYFFESRLLRIWRTEDAGASWERHDTLPWLDLARTRFFSPTFGITSNATTRDFGRTWTRLGRPFGRALFALDSARWFVADSFMLTGRTVDGGRTWTRSGSYAPFRAIVAHRGNVAIARSQRSVLASSDGGTTWRDVGVAGGLPDDLAQIIAMGFVDTTGLPGTLVGVAGFIDEQARRTAGLVHSSDFGQTWREGARIPTLDSAVFNPDMIETPPVFQSLPGIEGSKRELFIAGMHGLLASADDGATWELRSNDVPIYSLAMASPSSGVAISADWTVPEITLHQTTDGGRTWTRTYTAPEGYNFPIGIQVLDVGYRVMIANYSALYREWLVVSSEDGASWGARRGSYGGPALKGGDAHWSSPTRVHVVGRGGSILASSDAGATLEVHHGELPRFFHRHGKDPNLDSLFRPLVSVRDGNDIYVADYYRDLGKWTIGEGALAAPVASARRSGLDARLSLDPASHSATLRVATRASVDGAWIVDILGNRRSLALRDAADGVTSAIDLAALAAGVHVVVVRADGAMVSLPFVVSR